MSKHPIWRVVAYLAKSPILSLVAGVVLIVTGTWEILETVQGPGGFGGSETFINAAADLFFAAVGYAFGKLVPAPPERRKR